jgi:aerobic carbon-monoxide dehydrogenase medium subunit
MHAFDYQRPATLKDATAFLKKNENARILGGGQSLIPTLKMRLAQSAALVDVNALAELREVKLEAAVLTVGAGLRHSEVAAHKDVLLGLPALARVAAGIGDRQVRNMGTLGGSLANNDPAADYPAAVLGLGATIHTNRRSIVADKFFSGLYETALKPGEIITAVAFPLPKRAAYVKFKNPASRFALVGVFVSEGAGHVRVAVTGAGSAGVFRVKDMEKKLGEKFAPEAIAKPKVTADKLNGDLHATAEYRSHLITVMAQRAVAAALSGKYI